MLRLRPGVRRPLLLAGVLEADPTPPPETGVPPVALPRRLAAELVGTGLLVAVVVGSGIAAQRLSTDAGLRLLENALATGAGLVALILALGSVSGARFNPVLTLSVVVEGDLDARTGAAEAVAQTAGGIGGAILANAMFGLPAVAWSTRQRSSAALWLGEVVATFGLLTVILGVSRSRHPHHAAFAVAAYITAAYWFTSSTSFANPAVTIARTATDSFSGIAPSSAPAFIGAQVVGGAVAVGLDRFLRPRTLR